MFHLDFLNILYSVLFDLYKFFPKVKLAWRWRRDSSPKKPAPLKLTKREKATLTSLKVRPSHWLCCFTPETINFSASKVVLQPACRCFYHASKTPGSECMSDFFNCWNLTDKSSLMAFSCFGMIFRGITNNL